MTQTPGLLKELRNLLKKQMASAFERFSASVTKKYDDGTCGLGHTGDSSETFRKYIREITSGRCLTASSCSRTRTRQGRSVCPRVTLQYMRRRQALRPA
jgi:hypothetical protein